MSFTKYLCLQSLDCFLNYTSKAFLLLYQTFQQITKFSGDVWLLMIGAGHLKFVFQNQY